MPEFLLAAQGVDLPIRGIYGVETAHAPDQRALLQCLRLFTHSMVTFF